MRIEYCFTNAVEDAHRAQALAHARAIHLRHLLRGKSQLGAVVALLRSDASLTAVVLGLSIAHRVAIASPCREQLEALVVSLAFRLGVELRYSGDDHGRELVYNDLALRSSLAAQGNRLASAPTRELENALLKGAPIDPPTAKAREDALRLLERALESEEPLRIRLHERPPVLVWSTPGDSDLMSRNLRAHLETAAAFGHRDLSVVVLDDATDPTDMRAVVEELREQFDVPVLHLAERSVAGGPGYKAELRDDLAAGLAGRIGRSAAAAAMEYFGPGISGSANLGFWLLADRTTVWLDQDARPYVTRSAAATLPVESGEGFDSRVERVKRIRTLQDIGSPAGDDLIVEPVDFLHHADFLLDAKKEDCAGRCVEAGWSTHEDAGYERVRNAATPTDRYGCAPSTLAAIATTEPVYFTT